MSASGQPDAARYHHGASQEHANGELLHQGTGQQADQRAGGHQRQNERCATADGEQSEQPELQLHVSVHAAQQDSFDGSRLNAWAASLRPSLMVRYGANVLVRSVTVRWKRTANTPA